MTHDTIQTFVRQAAQGISRRGSLGLLGAATLAGVLAGPAGAGARDTGKKSGNAGRKSRKRCKAQRGECLAHFKKHCASAPDPAACEASWAPCCEPFGRCNAEAGLQCVFSVK